MKDLIKRMIKNPTRLAVKVFILIWFFLIVQIVLKVTFNYWQPYVIPTPQLQAISDFIDTHKVIKIILDGVFYIINAVLLLLCSTKKWKLAKKKDIILATLFIGAGVILSNLNIFIIGIIVTVLVTLCLPLLIDYKKILYTLFAFILSNVFLGISMWFNGFVQTDINGWVIDTFFMFDYYIMLGINYFVFNLVDFNKIFKKRRIKNGK